MTSNQELQGRPTIEELHITHLLAWAQQATGATLEGGSSRAEIIEKLGIQEDALVDSITSAKLSGALRALGLPHCRAGRSPRPRRPGAAAGPRSEAEHGPKLTSYLVSTGDYARARKNLFFRTYVE